MHQHTHNENAAPQASNTLAEAKKFNGAFTEDLSAALRFASQGSSTRLDRETAIDSKEVAMSGWYE